MSVVVLYRSRSLMMQGDDGIGRDRVQPRGGRIVEHQRRRASQWRARCRRAAACRRKARSGTYPACAPVRRSRSASSTLGRTSSGGQCNRALVQQRIRHVLLDGQRIEQARLPETACRCWLRMLEQILLGKRREISCPNDPHPSRVAAAPGRARFSATRSSRCPAAPKITRVSPVARRTKETSSSAAVSSKPTVTRSNRRTASLSFPRASGRWPD